MSCNSFSLSLAVVVLAGGCSQSSVEREIAAALNETSPSAGARGAASQFHDFGAVLAHGQTLRHDFSIANPASAPMRIVQSSALTPCCSAVEAVPESIRPGGEGTVSVNLKASRSSGWKRVLFRLETDSAEQPTIQLGLAADFSPEWEVAPVGRTAVRLAMGESGGMGFKIICRRLDREGRGLPERLESSQGITAKFDGAPQELNRDDGVIETSRTVAIAIAGGDQAGPHRGSIRYLWREGLEEIQEIGWEVFPLIRVHPSAIVFKASDRPVVQSLELRSEKEPFRILGVTGRALAEAFEPPAAASVHHEIQLKLASPSGESSAHEEIQITMDCARQPRITLGVIILPRGKESGASL